jgi:transcriptional regulator with PAS, ATPase and Fis domain
VAVNCSAIPETLLESELFGHEKGAFTGALQRREGYFELADGGTLFLDEITEMSPRLQAKYLRVLQDGAVRRLGAKGELRVDVRVIAATNREPAQAVKEAKLREDLYYRLNVLAIEMPLLRQRKEDIPLLVEEFIREFNEKYGKTVRGAGEASLRLLQQHDWPGNVRELRNMMERAVVQCGDGLIPPDSLRFGPGSSSAPSTAPDERKDVVVLPVGTKLDDAERGLILKTLKATQDDKTRAAEVLGVSPKTLHNKLQRYAAEDSGSA